MLAGEAALPPSHGPAWRYAAFPGSSPSGDCRKGIRAEHPDLAHILHRYLCVDASLVDTVFQ